MLPGCVSSSSPREFACKFSDSIAQKQSPNGVLTGGITVVAQTLHRFLQPTHAQVCRLCAAWFRLAHNVTADLLVSVDCKTSEPFPGVYALLSLDAVALSYCEGNWTLGEPFYQEWAPSANAADDPTKTHIHGLRFEKLAATRMP